MTKQSNEMKWNFDNSYARLPESFFTSLPPTPVEEPMWVMFNEPLAISLGLDANELQTEEGAAIFGGNAVPEGADPLAQAYAGHQFGHFAMLGDGRAVLLGEHITPSGERFDIQLKGSGPTPYSRRGDGRAALGPMLREFIISEAMHALGIPTSRSLAVVATGEAVMREEVLIGAVLTRVASSHIRVGTFEYAARLGNLDALRELADYTIARHYPDIADDDENRYLVFLQKVIERQASLIAKWQLVGFIHGVMNTDNMTIAGETIDYGPCAFMDQYDPNTVFSSIDVQGRYAYSNQPLAARWNLARFAESLLPLLHEEQDKAIELAEKEITRFMDLYEAEWLAGMRAKLGLLDEEPEDVSLVKDLLDMMQEYEADYTNTFIALTFDKTDNGDLFTIPEFTEWKERWQARRERQEASADESVQLMKNSNPAVIPRNHRVEEALEAAEKEGDLEVMDKLLAVLEKPFAHTPDQTEYATPPPPSEGPYQTFCGT